MYHSTNNQNESIEIHFLKRQFEDYVIMLNVIIYILDNNFKLFLCCHLGLLMSFGARIYTVMIKRQSYGLKLAFNNSLKPN